MPKGQHSGNRAQKSGLARVAGSGQGKHPAQAKKHVPQKVVQKSGNVTTTKSTKKSS